MSAEIETAKRVLAASEARGLHPDTERFRDLLGLAESLDAQAAKLRRLVIEAYEGEYPTNGWRKRAEDLDAWPGAGSEETE